MLHLHNWHNFCPHSPHPAELISRSLYLLSFSVSFVLTYYYYYVMEKLRHLQLRWIFGEYPQGHSREEKFRKDTFKQLWMQGRKY